MFANTQWGGSALAPVSVTDNVESSMFSGTPETDGSVLGSSVVMQERFSDSLDITSGEASSMEHPLHQAWNLYAWRGVEKRTQDTWKDGQVKACSFSTVEELWQMVNYVIAPSRIGLSDYSIFRSGIQPGWEDPAVSQGGRWVVRLPLKFAFLDDLWLDLMLAITGETFSGSNSLAVCGIVISSRPKTLKLALWLDTCDPTVCANIGKDLLSILKLFLDKNRPLTELLFQSFHGNTEYRIQDNGEFSVATRPQPMTTTTTNGEQQQHGETVAENNSVYQQINSVSTAS